MRVKQRQAEENIDMVFEALLRTVPEDKRKDLKTTFWNNSSLQEFEKICDQF